MKVRLFLLGFFLLALFSETFAQSCRKSPGRISRHEARILNIEKRHIEREKHLARVDGFVSRREQRHIQQSKQRLRRKSQFFYHN